jgi:hypothetical protein
MTDAFLDDLFSLLFTLFAQEQATDEPMCAAFGCQQCGARSYRVTHSRSTIFPIGALTLKFQCGSHFIFSFSNHQGTFRMHCTYATLCSEVKPLVNVVPDGYNEKPYQLADRRSEEWLYFFRDGELWSQSVMRHGRVVE